MPLLPITHQPQRRQADCLAACAKMLLDYHGIDTSYEQLTKVLKIGDAGAPFRNLLALRSDSLHVTIQQGSTEHLRRHINDLSPAIVFLLTEAPYWPFSTNHATVVSGFERTRIMLNDPMFAQAPLVVPIDEFELAWLNMDEYYALIHPVK
ncbi:MAG: C39 family peptidase [Caldilineaceae bacterium]|nr:C39 family peptidase [Caldilineaceae bacterium]